MDTEMPERSRDALAIMLDVKQSMLAYGSLELLKGSCRWRISYHCSLFNVGCLPSISKAAWCCFASTSQHLASTIIRPGYIPFTSAINCSGLMGHISGCLTIRNRSLLSCGANTAMDGCGKYLCLVLGSPAASFLCTIDMSLCSDGPGSFLDSFLR